MSTVLTIGHSTRSFEELAAMLQAHGITRLLDVRSMPGSRYNPQFNAEAMPEALAEGHIAYTHMPPLGGLRRVTGITTNLGWRNVSFRGFADYMQTPGFSQALDELIRISGEERVAIMCAEAVPWRCHRSLIADALVARGVSVEHIMSATKRQSHTLTPFAEVCCGQVTYPQSEP